MIKRALFAVVFCALSVGAIESSFAQALPDSGGWLGKQGGLMRSGRFPDNCAALTWRVAKGAPLTLIENLLDPIYLQVCNCRVDDANNSIIFLSYATKPGAKQHKRQLGIGQCVYVAAVDLTMQAKDLEAFGNHEIIANPRQTITVISKDGDDDSDEAAAQE